MAYSIMWFRRDLRLLDNQAFCEATHHGCIIPVYISETPGAASSWWLHHSLEALSASLNEQQLSLIVESPKAPIEIVQVFQSIVDKIQQLDPGAEIGIYFNLAFEPELRMQEEKLFEQFEKTKVHLNAFNSNYLFHPTQVQNKQNKVFQVFTPFWRHCLTLMGDNFSEAKPNFSNSLKALSKHKSVYDALMDAYKKNLGKDGVASLSLLPKLPWANEWPQWWQPGEKGALGCLKNFVKERISNYAIGRDFPALENVSRLSPHLHYGEVGPRQIWILAKQYEKQTNDHNNVSKFLAELGWREFGNYVLFYLPKLPTIPFRPAFQMFPWIENKEHLRAWQKGLTGYPIVDAGMRELWATGFMHNRVRMIVASFLTKHLLISWQEGASWFLDTLVDADLASNTAGWQWVAGCGCDASPYFRIFNPILQGEKFDKDGEYIKTWIPELKKCPVEYIHAPWTCPPLILKEKGITLGKTYPSPIVNHETARVRALDALKQISKEGPNID